MDDTTRFLVWFGAQLEQVRAGLDNGDPGASAAARQFIRNLADDTDDDQLFTLLTMLLCVCDVAAERKE